MTFYERLSPTPDFCVHQRILYCFIIIVLKVAFGNKYHPGAMAPKRPPDISLQNSRTMTDAQSHLVGTKITHFLIAGNENATKLKKGLNLEMYRFCGQGLYRLLGLFWLD